MTCSMNEAQENPTEVRDVITPVGKRLVLLWAACLMVLYLAGAYVGSTRLRGYAEESASYRQTRIASPTTALNVKTTDLQLPSAAKPVEVLVGGSLSRIGDFSMRESFWTANFNLWFRWDDDAVKPDTNFRIANGQIVQQEVVENTRAGRGRFVEYRMVARMTKDFDSSRIPFGENSLFIVIEDKSNGPGAVKYVADKRDSRIDPGALPNGMHLARFLADTKTGIRRVVQASLRPLARKDDARPQFLLAMLVVPDGLGLYQKMFQALFASVAIALIALYIKPTNVDCRFGLPVGGFFACISNNIYVGSLLPHADRLTLADMVNTTGLYTIFLILVQSVISLYVFETMGKEKLSHLFDRVSFAVFLIGCLIVNLALPLSARPL